MAFPTRAFPSVARVAVRRQFHPQRRPMGRPGHGGGKKSKTGCPAGGLLSMEPFLRDAAIYGAFPATSRWDQAHFGPRQDFQGRLRAKALWFKIINQTQKVIFSNYGNLGAGAREFSRLCKRLTGVYCKTLSARGLVGGLGCHKLATQFFI